MASGTSPRMARSASGSATGTPRGATAPQSRLVKAVASTGYKLQAAACASTGLPLAWRVETARHHESKFVAPLIDALHARGFKPKTVAMDKGYDNIRVYAEVEARGCDPVIPLRGAKANQVALPLALGGRLFPRIGRHTPRFKSLYRGRVAVEREFGRLKHDYGLAPLRTRGLERVSLHADLV